MNLQELMEKDPENFENSVQRMESSCVDTIRKEVKRRVDQADTQSHTSYYEFLKNLYNDENLIMFGISREDYATLSPLARGKMEIVAFYMIFGKVRQTI